MAGSAAHCQGPRAVGAETEYAQRAVAAAATSSEQQSAAEIRGSGSGSNQHPAPLPLRPRHHVTLSDRVREGVEGSPEESKRSFASSALPDRWGPFDSFADSLAQGDMWGANSVAPDDTPLQRLPAGGQASLGASPGQGRPHHTGRGQIDEGSRTKCGARVSRACRTLKATNLMSFRESASRSGVAVLRMTWWGGRSSDSG